MDYQLQVKLKPFSACVVNRNNEVLLFIDQCLYDTMLERGFLTHYKDTRGVWNYMYDKGLVTEADTLKAVVYQN